MEQLTHLPDKTQTQLLRTIDPVPQIRHRGDFFLWAQGHLQGVLPHSLLVGILLGSDGQVLYVDAFYGAPGMEVIVAHLVSVPDGPAVRAAQLTLQPVAGEAQADLDEQVREMLAGASAGAVVWCATGPIPGSGAAFFALIGSPNEPGPAETLLMRALLPQFHLALLRAYGWHMAREGLRSDGSDLLDMTERQMEILHWIKLGKTNFEIAQILDISALTVKNHLQKLFKKLNVHNRAQAVAKIMALSSTGKGRQP